MIPNFIKIVFTVLLTFIMNKVYSQDRLLSKNGDTLRVYVKNMDVKLVSYTLDKDPKSTLQEISRLDLYKILWRSGKELVIDAEFDKKVTADNPKTDNIIQNTSEKENVSKRVPFNNSKVAIDKETPPALVQETLPPAPELARKYRFFYIAYKVNGKRVKPKEFIKTVEKYDTDSYQEISEGYEMYRYHNKRRVIGSVGRIAAIPIVFVSPILYQTVILGTDVFTVIEGIKSWRGIRTLKEGIKLYERKRLSNSLHKAVLVPF